MKSRNYGPRTAGHREGSALGWDDFKTKDGCGNVQYIQIRYSKVISEKLKRAGFLQYFSIIILTILTIFEIRITNESNNYLLILILCLWSSPLQYIQYVDKSNAMQSCTLFR